MKNDKLTKFIIAAGVVVGGYVVYKLSQGVQLATEVVTEDLNPVSESNIINRGVSQVVKDATGFDNLGSWFYCLTHPNAFQEVCPDGKAGRPTLTVIQE